MRYPIKRRRELIKLAEDRFERAEGRKPITRQDNQEIELYLMHTIQGEESGAPLYYEYLLIKSIDNHYDGSEDINHLLIALDRFKSGMQIELEYAKKIESE